MVKCAPDERSRHELTFCIMRCSSFVDCLCVTPANGFAAPLVAPDVDENANQPRFRTRGLVRNRVRRSRRFQEGFLDKVERVIGARDKPACQSVQPIPVGVEEPRQTLAGRRLTPAGRSGHTVLNV